MRKGSSQAAILLELSNLITLMPSDNSQAKAYEDHRVAALSGNASRLLPVISYSEFTEVVSHLDQNGSTFDAFISRQVSTLYFLLRLHRAATFRGPQGTEKRIAVLDEDEEEPPDVPLPEGLLEKSPQATSQQLLANYLTESWNWYVDVGPTRNRHEAIARERIHLLVLQVVKVYGAWVWPFFHHYESSHHVDHMLKLVEDLDGRFPFRTRTQN